MQGWRSEILLGGTSSKLENYSRKRSRFYVCWRVSLEKGVGFCVSWRVILDKGVGSVCAGERF